MVVLARPATILETGAVVIATLVALSGCTNSGETANADTIPRTDLREIIQGAQTGGASAHQLSVMSRAQANGKMTYSDLSELLPDLLNCLDSSGFTTTVQPDIQYYPGFPIPNYGSVPPSNLTQKQVSDITADCSNANFDWVQVYYVSQGIAIDAYEQSFVDQRQAIVTCLRGHGVEVDDDAAADELIYLVTDDSQVPGHDLCYTGEVFVGYTRP